MEDHTYIYHPRFLNSLSSSPIQQDGQSEDTDFDSRSPLNTFSLDASHRWLYFPFFPEFPSRAIFPRLAEEQLHSTH